MPVVFLAIMHHDLVNSEMDNVKVLDLGRPSSNPGYVTYRSVSKLCHLLKSEFLFQEALPERAIVVI